MPTITIKQFDNTSAGVLRQPKNVFLIGPGTLDSNSEIKADTNGVYYFTSYSDFNNTLGVRTPEGCKSVSTLKKDDCKSYGNQIAAELLNLGYNVYYYLLTDDNFTAVISGTQDWSWLADISLYPIDYMATGFVGAGCYNLIAALREIVTERSGDCLLLVDMPTNNEYLKCLEAGLDLEGTYTAVDNSDKSFEVVITSDTITFTLPEGVKQSITYTTYTSESGVVTLYSDETAVTTVSLTAAGDVLTGMTYNGATYSLTAKDPITGTSSLLAKLAAETRELDLTKYCAAFAPLCEVSGLSTEVTYSNNILPASFYYLACAINAEENLGYKDWFAVAGLTRGRRSDRLATPSVAFGDRDATICAPRTTQADTGYNFTYAINLVTRQAGGFYIWGNRTGHTLTADGLTAEHFLNIHRLCMSLKKQIYSTCKKLTFDPNSDILWSNFVGGIEPLLKDMQANQGINGYKIIRVKSANDPKAMMRAKIRIVPIEAVEDFEIEISLEDLIEA